MLVGVFEEKENKFKIFTQTTYGIREIQQKTKMKVCVYIDLSSWYLVFFQYRVPGKRDFIIQVLCRPNGHKLTFGIGNSEVF